MEQKLDQMEQELDRMVLEQDRMGQDLQMWTSLLKLMRQW